MANRIYRQERRAEAAEQTRRRIVEATYALHSARGVAATTVAEIAERAGVSVGSIYHHFPTYDDAIVACGAYSLQRSPLPDDTIFTGASSRSERVERLASAIFTFYERLPGFECVRRDRDGFAPLRAFFDLEERRRIDLAAKAIGQTDHAIAATVAALLDVSVYSALRRAKLDSSAAVQQIADLINTWTAMRTRRKRMSATR